MKPAFAGPDTPDRALIDTCVHCGFCLPTCPTYVLWGEEMDSPRGRIYLMRAGVDGRTEMNEDLVQHMDRCLGCLACVTACPSGVQYGRIAETARAVIGPPGSKLARAVLNFAFTRVLAYPRRLKFIFGLLRLYQRIGLQRLLRPLGARSVGRRGARGATTRSRRRRSRPPRARRR